MEEFNDELAEIFGQRLASAPLPGQVSLVTALLHVTFVTSAQSTGDAQGREQQWNQHCAHINSLSLGPHSEHESSHVHNNNPAGLPEPGVCCKVEWGCGGNEIAAAAAALMRIDAVEQV